MARDKLWAIYSDEEQPIALTLAKTVGGAMKRFEDKTGRNRVEIHVEQVVFEKGFFSFLCAI